MSSCLGGSLTALWGPAAASFLIHLAALTLCFPVKLAESIHLRFDSSRPEWQQLSWHCPCCSGHLHSHLPPPVHFSPWASGWCCYHWSMEDGQMSRGGLLRAWGVGYYHSGSTHVIYFLGDYSYISSASLLLSFYVLSEWLTLPPLSLPLFFVFVFLSLTPLPVLV